MSLVMTQPPADKMDTLSVLKLRKQLGEVLDKAYYQARGFVIERAGKEMAVILPMPVYRWMLQVKQRSADDFFAQSRKFQKAFSDMSEGELEALVDEAVQAVRLEKDTRTPHP